MNIATRFINPSKAALFAMVLALATLPGFAFATGPTFALPTAEVLGYIAICVAFVSAVGAAILGMIYLAKAFRWGRKAG